MHHTSFGAPQWPNGAVEGGLRRRRRRFTVKPSRSNSAPMVLTAGHAVRGHRSVNHPRTFTGPQLGCARRKARLGNLGGHRLRVMQRRPRAIEETLNPTLPVSLNPLVPNPTAHPEPAADSRKRLLAILNRHDEPHSLIHDTSLQ